MDITRIDPQQTTPRHGIKIGDPHARHTLLEFINLRCPYCRKWHQLSEEILKQAVADGRVYRVIKLYDKDKESLQRGNVMHRFVPKDDPTAALAAIDAIFATQKEWGDLSLEETAEFARTQLGLQEAADSATTAAIKAEAAAANIQFVPTVILDEHIFDESISPEALTDFLV